MKKEFTTLLLCAAALAAGAKENPNQVDTTLMIKDVVVTGSQVSLNRNNLPQTISVVTAEDIERSGHSELLPAVASMTPSFFVTQRSVMGCGVSNGSAGQINIRGIGSGVRVLTMFDGQPQWAGVFGHSLPDTYNASEVERIEIIRGSSSMLYGSNAMGGVINIITKSEKQEGLHSSAGASYGSYNTQRYNIATGHRGKKLDFYLALDHNRTDGERENTAFKSTNGYAKLSYQISNPWRVTADVLYTTFFAENPGSIYAPMFDYWGDVTRNTYSLSFTNRYEKTDGAIKIFSNQGKHTVNDGHLKDADPQQYLFHSKDHVTGITAYQSARFFKGNVLTLGLDYKNWGGKAWAKDVQGDKTINETAVYIAMQQSLWDVVTLNGGVRLEMNDAYGNHFVPQLGAAIKASSSTTVKLSYSKGFRSPNIKELYMYMPANPDLLPEKVDTYDITLAQQLFSGVASVELTGYMVKGKNLIILAPDGPKMKYRNAAKVENKGVEFTGRVNATKNLKFTAIYAYLNMKEAVLASPEHQLSLNGYMNLKKWDFTLEYQLNHGIYMEEKPKSPYVWNRGFGLLNAVVSYRPVKQLRLFVRGENLTDKPYTINYGFPMPGILVTGGVNVKF